MLLPHLARMGIDAALETESNGFTPDVVGSVNLSIKSLDQKARLNPFELTERGG